MPESVTRYWPGTDRGVGVVHYIYTKEEANERGIKYVPWRKAIGPCWVVSDDDLVLECLSVRYYGRDPRRQDADDNGRRRYKSSRARKGWFKFSIGCVWESQKYFAARPMLVHWVDRTHGKPQSNEKRLLGQGKYQTFIKFYALLLVRRQLNLDEDDWMILARMLRPKDPERGMKVVFKFIKHPDVVPVIAQAIMDALDKHGAGADYIVAEYKDLVEKAKDAGDLEFAKVIIDQLVQFRSGERPFGPTATAKRGRILALPKQQSEDDDWDESYDFTEVEEIEGNDVEDVTDDPVVQQEEAA